MLAAGDSRDAGCPYPGLAAFTAEQAQWFFGREQLTSDLLGRLNGQLGEGGPVMVVGASGAGKSSLLQAGLLHKVADGGLTPAGSRHWPRIHIVPGAHPMHEAAAALRASLPAGVGEAGVAADPGPDVLDGLLRRALEAAIPQAGPAARAVIVVDQFEELFTVCGSEDERRSFISWLWRTAGGDGPGGPLALVACGLRADFYGECSRYPELRQALTGDQVLVGPMSPGDLAEAIMYPAQATGLEVEPGLVEILLRDLGAAPQGDAGVVSGYDAGRLPLLAHALQSIWRQRHGSVLTVDGYLATGGISHALEETAEHAFRCLSPDAVQEARAVFLRLIRIGDAGEDTRRRVSRDDFLRDSPQPAVTQAVLDTFTGSRLLTQDLATIEITHEALIRGWPRLRTWIDQDRASHLARQDLSEAAATWDRSRRDPAYLYRGTLLQAAAETAARTEADPTRYAQLSQTESSFLQASDRASRRAAHGRRAVIAGLTVLTLAAITAAGFAVNNAADAGRQAANAVRQANNAARQHAIALSRQLAAESLTTDPTDPLTARHLAVAAWRASPTSQAASAMTTLLAKQEQEDMLPVQDPSDAPDAGGDTAIAFSPDGRLLATTEESGGTVRLWDPATRQPVGAPLPAEPGGTVDAVAFSPDGRLLATANWDRTVRLWDPATRQLLGTLPAEPGGRVQAVAFSPDGRLLATANGDSAGSAVRLWDPATRQLLRTLPADPRGGIVHAVAFSPDGKLLATAENDGTVQLWNPAVPRQPLGTLPAVPGNQFVSPVAFSPDGKLLATVGSHGTLRLWNPTSRQLLGTLPADSSGSVHAVAFSPDGKLLATAGGPGDVLRLWDPASRQPVGAPLPADTGLGGTVEAVAFSPDGRLATSNSGGTVQLWNPATRQPVGAPLPAEPGGTVDAVAFSPDGRLLATAGGDSIGGTVQLWDPATRQLLGTLPAEPGGTVDAVAFSPDGRLLATAGGDSIGTVWLWNPATRKPVGTLPVHPAHISTIEVSVIAFSPDGKLLAVGGFDSFHSSSSSGGILRLWNLVTRQPASTRLRADPGTVGSVEEIAFSRDGKLLATGSNQGTIQLNHGTIQLWNPATRQRIGDPLPAGTGPSGRVNAVAFSPDGKLLAAGDADSSGGTVRLWDAATRQPVGGPLPAVTGPSGSVNAVAFSPDGKLLAATGSDGTVRFWRVPLFVNPYLTLCRDVGPPTRAEWAQYAPGEPFSKACA